MPDVHAQQLWNDNVTFVSFAALIGVQRQFKLQAAMLAITAFVLIFGGTTTASFMALVRWDKTPHDFAQKGTLSNLAQDQSTPHGRLWTTALVIGAVLLLTSMYPFWLYRSWAPWVDVVDNPLALATFQSRTERLLRTAWVVLPSVGFILAGIIPSLSDADGLYLVLTVVHNVSAPISISFCMVMETVQLHFGENAFRAFFGSGPATKLYGPLSKGQRLRVGTLVVAWLSGALFVLVQSYLALFENALIWLAQTSYMVEVCAVR